MVAYTLADALKDSGGKLAGRFKDTTVPIPYIEQNTRHLKGGSMFIPFNGKNVDGHDYIEEALAAGCIGCLTEKELPEYRDDKFYIVVDDVKDAVWRIIEAKIRDCATKIVCVTGSVGKTTTTGMIANVLAQKYSVLRTVKNWNDEYLAPEILFQINDDYQYAVIEVGMGMNSSVSDMAKHIRPDIIVLTNIGYAHIEKTGSLEATRDEKCGAEAWLADGGIAVVNRDDQILMSYKYTHMVAEYGREKGDWNLCDHVVYPQRASITVGRICGLDDEEIAEGIRTFKNDEGRMDVIKSDKLTLIDASFNASVASIADAIEYLGKFEGTRIAVLGEMLELGAYAQKLHILVGGYVTKFNVDIAILVGGHALDVAEGIVDKDVEVHCAAKIDDAELMLRNALAKLGDEKAVVLVKGSHGSNVHMIAARIKEECRENG